MQAMRHTIAHLNPATSNFYLLRNHHSALCGTPVASYWNALNVASTICFELASHLQLGLAQPQPSIAWGSGL